MRHLFLFSVLVCLAGCADRSFTPVTPEALAVGTPYTVFAATTRAQESDGSFGFDRSKDLSLLELTVSIPPNHKAGDLDFAYARPDPTREFTLAGQDVFDSPQEFRQRIRQSMSRTAKGGNELTLFIHGYNATQTETAFRAAQLAHDLKAPGTMMIYSWPSRGKVLGYAYDGDSMMFARDGLERVLRQIRATNAKLLVVAHSMGSVLFMEALRQIEIAEPGWSKRNLLGVVLISPDLDTEVFRSQVSRIDPLPQPFFIFVSEKDKALSLSSRLRGTGDRTRLGNSASIDQISDLPITVIDTTAFDAEAKSSHLVVATSPALITMINDARQVHGTFSPERIAIDLFSDQQIVKEGQATGVELEK